MRILIAPDSFKDCLSAKKVAACIAEGIGAICPEWECMQLPLADGGEGTVEAFDNAKAGAVVRRHDIVDALGRPVEACTLLLPDGRCVVEMATAAGLEQLAQDERNPMKASTFGLGVLLKQCLEDGCRNFIIGLGGSATVDGGVGMLQALGFEFHDEQNHLIPNGAGGATLNRITAINDANVPQCVREMNIVTACDVTTTLPDSAVVYGPQKGATPEMVDELTRGLKNFAQLLGDDGTTPGDGAAGSIGYAFRRLLGAHSRSGAELLLEYADFDAKCRNASFVITGEGRTDSQSAAGKLCGVVARHAANCRVPVILASGALASDLQLPKELYCAAFSISSGELSLDDAIRNAPKNLRRFGSNIASILNSQCSILN